MLKEGVRLDRVRGGRQKYRRMANNPYNSLSLSTCDGLQRSSTLDGNSELYLSNDCNIGTYVKSSSYKFYYQIILGSFANTNITFVSNRN